MSRRPGARARRRAAWSWCALSLLLVAAAGCSPAQYAAQADRAAYGLIAEKQDRALHERRAFGIAPCSAPAAVDGAAPAAAAAPILLNGQPIPVAPDPPRTLTLVDCLELAAANSRSFQTRKEALYTEALALANLRHDWRLVDGPAGANVAYARSADGRTGWTGDGELGLGFTQRLVDGGVLTLAATLDMATNFVGIRETTFGSLIEANFTQPLWRGAWRGFAYEELYRAERDLAIRVLDYDRFTQTFAVTVATEYYRVLQGRDALANEQENLNRLEQTTKFVQAQVEGGMVSRVQADQAEQDLLNARARVESTRQGYEDALDAFKLTLGIPIASAVELKTEELTALAPLPFPFALPEAVQIALRSRPDVLTAYAGLRDAERDVEIAADGFNPRVDLNLAVAAPGKEPRTPFETQFHRNTHSAGVTVDYRFDQTDNRDAYRLALIARQRAHRDLEEFLDRVRLDVRQSFRALQQSARTYEIQKAAVALAIRRTKLVQQEQKEGLASTRDVLEAEDALRNSKNAATAALVDYVTTRMRFLATLGMIGVTDQGRMNERSKPHVIEHRRGLPR